MKTEQKNGCAIFNCNEDGLPCYGKIDKNFLVKIVNFVNELNFVYSEKNVGEFQIGKFFEFINQNGFIGWLMANQTNLTFDFMSSGNVLKIDFNKDGIRFIIDSYCFSKNQIEEAIGIKIK